MRRHTQHTDANCENGSLAQHHLLTSLPDIHGKQQSKIAHLGYLLISMCQSHLYHELHTLKYKKVMRDQRWLCCELMVVLFWHRIRLTQTSSTFETVLSEVAAPIVVSTYLLSKCEYWRDYKVIGCSWNLPCSPQSYITPAEAATAKPQPKLDRDITIIIRLVLHEPIR